jgi:peptidoglycan/xylan/chitin deacetylase (PgdA/CDA1 family)
MARHHRVMAAGYHVLKTAKAIRRALGGGGADSLRVLTYHDIAPDEDVHFAAQLRWLARSWRFVSASQFAALISGSEPVRGRNLLLTFDDGFASSRRVAEQVLKPMGIHALFFVVSEFVTLVDRGEARRFIAKHIQPGRSIDDLPAHLYNMNWSDLEALLEQGHCIGAHTRTHARLSQINGESDLESEIILSADALAQRLHAPVEHFAYTFGDLGSFSRAALGVARRRFRFVYSGLRGDNARDVPPAALRRDAVSATDSTALLGAYLEGAADFRYANSRIRLDSWCKIS